MNRLAFAALASLMAFPALANNLSVEIPTLIWPQDQSVSGGKVTASSKDCTGQATPKLTVCKP